MIEKVGNREGRGEKFDNKKSGIYYGKSKVIKYKVKNSQLLVAKKIKL